MLKPRFTLCIAFISLLGSQASVFGQEVCHGDIDGDGFITSADADRLLPLLFTGIEPDSVLFMRADANDDGSITAADVGAILAQDGSPCPGPSPTPSMTPTPTPTPPSGVTPTPTPSMVVASTFTPTQTATPTRTPTHTRTPTPTPTVSCPSMALQPGMISGELTAFDCRRLVRNRLQYVDVYTVTGTPGQAIRVELISDVEAQYIAVIDPGGQFGIAEGKQIEFAVTTTLPYEIWVTSLPDAGDEFGPYNLTLGTRTCAAPIPLSVSHVGSFTGTECPDPAFPSIDGRIEPVILYTFEVQRSQIPRNMIIDMIVSNLETIFVDPVFSVLSPDGYEILLADEDGGPGPSQIDERARFLALQPGTYTIIASAGGGVDSSCTPTTCRYTIRLTSTPTCTRQSLPSIPADMPLRVTGTLRGRVASGTNGTACGAPLGTAVSGEDIPEVNSPADLYTFTAAAGEVISIEMDSEDDPHLFVIGPASCDGLHPDCVPNRLIARDGEGGFFAGAHVAATLVHPGTYTIVAANNVALFPPDREDPPTDPGETIQYELFIQKCPAGGGLTVSGGPMSASFNVFSCLGFGGLPFRSHSFQGTAGQFVTATVTSNSFDAFVRIFAPDGSVVENDDDPFVESSTHARASRILPVTGTYLVEVSSSPEQGAVVVAPPAAYTVQVQSCPVTAAVPGDVTGAFQDADCALPDGRRFDVYTLERGISGEPSLEVAGVQPPSGACVLALMAEGPQIPLDQCSNGIVEMPMQRSSRYGFVIAAGQPGTRGPYTARLSRCSAQRIGFGQVMSGQLTSTDCVAASGGRADWYVASAPAGLVRFNSNGVAGSVQAQFPLSVLLTNLFGSLLGPATFADDPTQMLPLGPDLGVLIRVGSATPGLTGSYTVRIDSGELRQ